MFMKLLFVLSALSLRLRVLAVYNEPAEALRHEDIQ
jgi:hypothetical protein